MRCSVVNPVDESFVSKESPQSAYNEVKRVNASGEPIIYLRTSMFIEG